MTDSHYERAGNGRVLGPAMAAVALILAGLAVMTWDDGRNSGNPPLSILQQR